MIIQKEKEDEKLFLNSLNRHMKDFCTFNYEHYTTKIVEYNEELDGYVITFKDTNHRAFTQFDTETNRLRENFRKQYLERYTDIDDKLTEEEDQFVNEFVEENKCIVSEALDKIFAGIKNMDSQNTMKNY